MANELLDFEAPLYSKYEKFLNDLEAIPSYLKLLFIALFSLFSGLIIHYKASPEKGSIFDILVATGGLFILVMTIGFFLQFFIAISKTRTIKESIFVVLAATGGFFILIMIVGFSLQLIFAISYAIIDLIIKSTPKIEKLGILSLTLILALLSVITIATLSIFTD